MSAATRKTRFPGKAPPNEYRGTKRRRETRAAIRGSALERLKPAEANAALHRLLALRPALRAEAEKIARDLVGDVSSEALADEVEDAMKGLGIEDLHGRSGSRPWGYTEPGEAAWAVLEDVVVPFVDDMKRQMDLGLSAEALETCRGIVLGLYRLERNKDAELLEWAPDFAAEAAGGAVEIWLRGGGSRERSAKSVRGRNREGFPQDFITQCVPEWAAMLARVQSKSRSR